MARLFAMLFGPLLSLLGTTVAAAALNAGGRRGIARSSARMVASVRPASVFSAPATQADVATLKQQLLQLGASLDRGQAYNPSSGEHYAERMSAARERVDALIRLAGPPPTSLAEMEGEWELIFTTVRARARALPSARANASSSELCTTAAKWR
jgi:hypothetical protein